MAMLDFLSWLFYALEEDDMGNVFVWAMAEAGIAVVIAVLVHHFTDRKDIERRVDRLETFAENAASELADIRRTINEWSE